MIGSLYLNRRKDFPISNRKRSNSLLDKQYNTYATTDVVRYDPVDEEDPEGQNPAGRCPPKNRNCCGLLVHTPNSSRFADHLHSRVLQKFPFLVEMFYWILNYVFYLFAKAIAERLFSNTGVWDMAESHGIRLLEIEHKSWSSIFFPIAETDLQHWFMDGHLTALTFLNRAYSLVHIPGTVSFISWYYFAAPSHDTFTVVRRTMSLTNLLAFTVFTIFPTMPPRLLPKGFGFHDTVRHDNAESVWQSGKYANQLAAMPSLHFGYAFCIGCTFIYHSGVFRRQSRMDETVKSKSWKSLYVIGGVLYPALVLTVIIATANHYWLDAVASVFVVSFAFFANRVFLILLPLEDMFLWVTRLEKPAPSTGENKSERLLYRQPSYASSDDTLA